MEISLQHPFTNAAGQRFEKLTIRRVTRGDVKAANKHSKDDGEQEDFLFARITGMVLEDIDLLDLADSNVLASAFRAMAAGRDVVAAIGRGPADDPAPATV